MINLTSCYINALPRNSMRQFSGISGNLTFGWTNQKWERKECWYQRNFLPLSWMLEVWMWMWGIRYKHEINFSAQKMTAIVRQWKTPPPPPQTHNTRGTQTRQIYTKTFPHSHFHVENASKSSVVKMIIRTLSNGRFGISICKDTENLWIIKKAFVIWLPCLTHFNSY